MSQDPAATPVEETATPANDTAQTPPATPTGEDKEVTLKESEVAKLRKDAARASSAQSELDTLKRRSNGRAPKTLPPEPFTEGEQANLRTEITRRVLSNPEYQQALNQNPLLKRSLLGSNPLALLEETQFVDAKDAVDQLFDFIENEVLTKGGGGEPPANTTAPASSPTPPAINAPEPIDPVKTPQEKAREELNKLSGMDKATASILSRVKVKGS